MCRRPRFIPKLPGRVCLAILLGGASLGLSLAWLQKRFHLNPRVVETCLLILAGVLLLWSVLLINAYAKELRRAEEEWADYDDGQADHGPDEKRQA